MGPTDAELLAVLDEYERQLEEEAQAAAAAVDQTRGDHRAEEELSQSEESRASHRRRRLHAAGLDEQEAPEGGCSTGRSMTNLAVQSCGVHPGQADGT